MKIAAVLVAGALFALAGPAAASRDSAPPDTTGAIVAAIALPSGHGVPEPAEGGPGPGHWFYQGLSYGSDALVHPVRLVFNGGFGTLQFENRSNRLSDLRLRHGWSRLWADVRRPVETIQLGGWNEFLGTEVVPVSAKRANAQYWPNYTLHLIGGGMSSRMMREWFEQNGWRHPALGAGITLSAYHLLNEVVEAGPRNAPSTDAIADLMLFDPAGVWLFSHDGVAGFFSRRLNLRDWSSQPAIDPVTGAVENNGQNFSMKLAIPGSDHWSLFYYFGNHGELGLSYRLASGDAISAGGGFQASALEDLGNGAQTADLVPSGGVFWDRHGSLLASLTTAKTSRDGMRLNVYPGLVRVFGEPVGLFVLRARDGGVVAGVHLASLPIGVAGRP